MHSLMTGIPWPNDPQNQVAVIGLVGVVIGASIQVGANWITHRNQSDRADRTELRALLGAWYAALSESRAASAQLRSAKEAARKVRPTPTGKQWMGYNAPAQLTDAQLQAEATIIGAEARSGEARSRLESLALQIRVEARDDLKDLSWVMEATRRPTFYIDGTHAEDLFEAYAKYACARTRLSRTSRFKSYHGAKLRYVHATRRRGQ